VAVLEVVQGAAAAREGTRAGFIAPQPNVQTLFRNSVRGVHVERFESALWQTASLLLVADGEAIAIDPCITRGEVDLIAARARGLGARVTHVLVTHADWDHVCGIAAFPDAVAAMGTRTAELVAGGEPERVIAERALEYRLEVAGKPRVDRALAPGAAYRLGPFTVEAVALPGHTPDGTAYRVRALGLLAVGDHLSAVEFPFASSTADYRSTLARLIDLLRHDPPARVVPGHGPALTAAEALDIAEADLTYLHALRDAVAGARDRERARAAGLAVALPRAAPADLGAMRVANVEAQIEELHPAER
jgi:glyoxylase-like metal-dependent hydrolase (beta-lactamase superfamily II)